MNEEPDPLADPDGLRLGDPALLEIVISRTRSVADRARALRLLGVLPTTPMTMVAVAGPAESGPAMAKQLGTGGAWTRHASLGSVHAIASAAPVGRELQGAKGIRIGVGTVLAASDAPDSWEQALIALRFAAPSGATRSEVIRDSIFHYADLGANTVLARHLRSADLAGLADVEALDLIAASRNGDETLEALRVFVWAGSLRNAARELHMHHRSVATRIAAAETMLGFRLADPYGVIRLGVALILRRLRDNDLIS
ncbi:helix-turn-helix domain-containing protein [Nocardia sp. NPDC051030]|uniref:helix-turn-helix domain-containing protein n=1 Tax=Nocardia sp. NPDC051030 TaxID=3155162 RepID=UPI0034295043